MKPELSGPLFHSPIHLLSPQIHWEFTMYRIQCKGTAADKIGQAASILKSEKTSLRLTII